MSTPAPILQTRLPHAPWMDPRTARLPGILPVEGDDWLRRDEAFAAQMAERDRLLAERRAAVYADTPGVGPAASELLVKVLAWCAGQPGYRREGGRVCRPDGVWVALDQEPPLVTAGRLVQEDLCILEKQGAEHVLTGAVLCFPASWTLAEKIGRPLLAIHIPVAQYTEDMARRVQRLFDAIRPEQPLWRANALTYADPTLHQPRTEGDRRPRPASAERHFMRSERQCLIRLPQTQAVVFTIHTYVVPLSALTEDERVALAAAGL